tara:strand:- start:629 stop:1255 length:627 start_codon:yes stop_codon:yes gene_type:complete
MSHYNPDHQKDMWSAESASPSGEPYLHIDLRAITIQTWISLILVWSGKIAVALMMGASFTIINPVATDVYLADFLPLPAFLENITMNAVINGGLGLATILLPTTLWKYVLSDECQANPRGYFLNQPVRIGVAVILVLAYLMLILLEILALRARIHGSLDTGPIASIGAQPEILPMAIASCALILGTCLLGLASASLSKSISKRFSAPL